MPVDTSAMKRTLGLVFLLAQRKVARKGAGDRCKLLFLFETCNKMMQGTVLPDKEKT